MDRSAHMSVSAKRRRPRQRHRLLSGFYQHGTPAITIFDFSESQCVDPQIP